MKIQPLKEIKEPNYPQKGAVCVAKLKTSIPKRWITCSAAKIVLGTLAVVSLAGCTLDGNKTPDVTTNEQTASGAYIEVANTPQITCDVPLGTPTPSLIMRVPFFVHGQGVGEEQGVFLTEEEVCQAINEVAEDYELRFLADSTFKVNVILPITNLDSGIISRGLEKADLIFDYLDLDNKIAIEFVSKEDVVEWKRSKDIADKIYPIKDTAEKLGESLNWELNNRYEDYHVGILYDPCATDKETSIEEVKAQAEDFFEWLKGEGII